MACTGRHKLREQEDQTDLDVAFSLTHIHVKEAHILHSLPLKWSKLNQMFVFSV